MYNSRIRPSPYVMAPTCNTTQDNTKKNSLQNKCIGIMSYKPKCLYNLQHLQIKNEQRQPLGPQEYACT